MSAFRSGLREDGRPRASAVAAALRTFGFGAAPPGAGLARALLVLSVLFASATAAQAQTTLVSNAGEGRDNVINAGNSASGRITQRFTTGSNMTGYDLSSVGIHIHEDNSSSSETITVSVHRFDSSETNNLGELVATLSTPSTLNEGAVNDFTAPSNTRLLPNTRYLVNIVGVGNHTHDFQIGVTNSDAETGAAGWLIENAFRLNGILVTAAIMMNVRGSNWVPPLIPTLDSAEAFFVNGALRYRFDLRLSEGVSIPYREMRDHAFSVTNGRMDGAKRIHKERMGGNLYSNHWRMTVAPVDETKPVTVTLRGNRPCSDKGALCTGGGGQLDGSPALTLSTDTEPPDLSSLPSLSIADTSGTEDSANLAFDVSLSKAVSATIAVDFRTVSGGTATANADYQEASYRIVFSAGERGAQTVVPEDLDQVASASPEDEKIARVRIAPEVLLNLQRQRVHAAPHVRHTGRKPDPHAARNRDHRRSRTPITRASAEGSSARSTITRRPPASTISIRPVAGGTSATGSSDGGCIVAAPTSWLGTAPTTTGTNPSIPVSRAGSRNSRRHANT